MVYKIPRPRIIIIYYSSSIDDSFPFIAVVRLRRMVNTEEIRSTRTKRINNFIKNDEPRKKFTTVNKQPYHMVGVRLRISYLSIFFSYRHVRTGWTFCARAYVFYYNILYTRTIISLVFIYYYLVLFTINE